MIADVHLLTLMKTSRKIEVLLLRDLKKKIKQMLLKRKSIKTAHIQLK